MHLTIRLFGPFQVELDGQPVTAFKSNKVRALLAYLAMECDRPHHRNTLAGMLWPNQHESAALSALRDVLSNLRLVLGDRSPQGGFVQVGQGTLQFNILSDYWLDISVFTELLAGEPTPARLGQAVALYRGEFLEGLAVGDSFAFEEWILLQRERLVQQVTMALHRLGTLHEEQGAYAEAQACARRQLQLDPYNEHAQQQLMRALALAGQRNAALAQYENFRRLLARDLEVEPEPDTIILVEKIRRGALSADVCRRGDNGREAMYLTRPLLTVGSAGVSIAGNRNE